MFTNNYLNSNSNSNQPSTVEEKVLAIDFGTKRIGLAISRLSLALPLAVIEYTDLTDALTKIKQYCQEHQAARIVIGLSEQGMAQKTKQFKHKLEEVIDLPIEFADETMTSQQVRAKLKEKGIKNIKKPIDHYAAALILDEWISLKS